MRYPEFHYRWTWQLLAPAEALWPLVSDTNRFNRDAGLPAVHEPSAMDEVGANGRRRLRFRRLGVPIAWEEEPFEWVRPQRFGVRRRYARGPVSEMRVLTELQPGAGGTRLMYDVWARPRNLAGLIGIPIQIGILSRQAFGKVFREYDVLAGERMPSPMHLPAQVQFAPGGEERLKKWGEALREGGAPPELVSRLLRTLAGADDLEVSRLRPYALADAWGAPRRAVLELCLWATRLGLLEFRWDLLCPLCRGTKETGASLAGVGSQVHCSVCNIDSTVNFDRFVEVTFRSNRGVREFDVGEFCVGGPQVTPHIVAQQLLQPGEERTLSLPLEEGRYRLRALSLPGSAVLSVSPGGRDAVSVVIDGQGWPEGEIEVSTCPSLSYCNRSDDEQLVILERTAWSDTAATAADVTALQLFRDLFSREALRPGQHISVGSMAILFTDLRGSTRLYRKIGDAPAFGVVMNHFDVLREAVAEEGGAIVKTIGDAVMAVFRRPVGGMRAMLKAQQVLANPPDGSPPLPLKAGMHYGPAIAVTLNDRLDYFGSTVNIAARLEGLSSGANIIISSAVRDDPEVAALLTAVDSGWTAQPLEASLKGLEERFTLWQVAMDEPAGMPDHSPYADTRR